MDWESGRFENDTLSIPTLSKKPILIKRLKNPNSSIYLYTFLLVTKNKSNNTFDYNFKVFIAANGSGFNKDSYHLYDINNKLILNKEKLGNKKTSKTSKISDVECQLWGMFSIDLGTGRETLLYTWNVCSRSGQPEQAPPGNEGGGGGETAPAEILTELIDITLLDPCPKGIMAQLKNTTNAGIAAILEKLGANSIYTVTMEMGVTDKGYAKTQKISSNNYTIKVDGDRYKDGTQLFKAASLIHELIHAYYLSVVDDNNTPSTNLSLDNFPALYQAYVEKKYPGGASVAQHDQMAKDYVDSMALALQEYYFSNITFPYSNPSYEVFTDLAWGTLQEASIFEEKFKNDTATKERILNRYRCESSSKIVEAGTPNQQIPIGKPCN